MIRAAFNEQVLLEHPPAALIVKKLRIVRTKFKEEIIS